MAEADEWIREFHECKDYAKPWVYRYRCRWCGAWHMTRIKDRERVARARVEKQRRKWLVAREVKRRSLSADDVQRMEAMLDDDD